ncbi:protocatechuate 3,4-dioxygenase subunit alpha [Povalibacter sp.]|uniref:protocatechuate 3,4-dioxygenase subunit alpha n=1 Tax=Povalibacter sp. TaxID=1962978 RepID=UPI002F4057E9
MSVTPSQTVGPFFQIGLAHDRWTHLCVGDGERLRITGVVFDADGRPVTDALLEIWQPDRQAFGRFAVDPDSGTFAFDAIRPASLSAGESPHLCVGLFARGLLKRLYTRIYFQDEAANAIDPVLALVPTQRRATLMALPARSGSEFRFDIRLAGPGETVFFEC